MGPTVRVTPLQGIPIISGDVVIDTLMFNPTLIDQRDVLTNFYTKNLKKVDVPVDGSVDNIATLNVHIFEPINLNFNRMECMTAVLQLMKKFSISIMALQEVPLNKLDIFQNLVESYGLYHTIDDFDYGFADTREPITNVVLSTYPITERKKLLLSSENCIYKHRHAIFFKVPAHPRYGDKLFCTTHLEVDKWDPYVSEMVTRKLQIKDIFNYNQGPDIIMGDLNLVPDSPEYALLATKYKLSSHVDFTAPAYAGIPNIVDYIWFRKKDETATWHIDTYAVNYIWSDHRPVIGIYRPK